MEPFKRRTYHSLEQMWRDVKAIMARRGELRALMRGETLDPAFRERLMLAVTEVNGCRYCAYAHAKMALKAGISNEELCELAEGDFGSCPDDEAPALLYAQHWAETEGKPDPEARQRIVESYGAETTETIELALRMIQMGNLGGNTWDAILYRISFGRWGGDAKQTA